MYGSNHLLTALSVCGQDTLGRQEIVGERDQITSELRATEDASMRARQMEAVRYSLVHAEWFETPTRCNRMNG